MAEITLKEVADKFKVTLNLPEHMMSMSVKYFEDKNTDEILDMYLNHHTEQVDGKMIHVFTEEIADHTLELIIDEKDGIITEYEVLDDKTRQPLFLYGADGTEIIYD